MYNLASGCPLPGDITESLLSVAARGTSLRNTFFKRLRQSQEDKELFFDQVKRIEWKGFLSLNKKVKVSSKAKSKDVAVQRDILGLLAAKSHQQNAAINIDRALCYPLAPVPLSMATADGARRKTAKSKLFDAALSSITNGDREPSDVDTENKVYILDLAAAIRSTVAIPDTFRDLSLQILSQLPKNYETIYVACDTYQEKSIKNSERSVRGVSDKMVIRSPEMRTPADFKKFLNNGDNKERLFEIIEEVWIQNKHLFGERIVYFARGSKCTMITQNGSTNISDLETDHEEADTKIAYLIQHAVRDNEGQRMVCTVRSSSGDIDIPVILLGMDTNDNVDIFIDNGSGNNRKILDLQACQLSSLQKKALVGLHAFTGNDYIACFLRKGKQLCWKQMNESESFLELFGLLGTETNLSAQSLDGLEKFVCRLYSEKSVDDGTEARSAIFWKKMYRDNTVTDISLLPPC